MVMLSDAIDQWKPMPAAIYLYVNDTDATYKHAFQVGCTSVMESAVTKIATRPSLLMVVILISIM